MCNNACSAEEDAEIARNLERQIIDKHKEEIRKKQMQDEVTVICLLLCTTEQ